MSTELTIRERSALERLMAIAQRDTGQSARVANFLLAWWNAAECGGFDLTDAWSLDEDHSGRREDDLRARHSAVRVSRYAGLRERIRPDHRTMATRP